MEVTSIAFPAEVSRAADVRDEVARYVAWSMSTPHGQRTATAESVDAALRRSRMEVMRTVAAIRDTEGEFVDAKPSRLAQPTTQEGGFPPCSPRKALYPCRATPHFKTVGDLTPSLRTQTVSHLRSSHTTLADAAAPFPALEDAVVATTVVQNDPRLAVAEKHRAAVEVARPQIPPRVAQSLQNHSRCLGAVKPYGLAHHIRHGDSRRAVQFVVDSNEHFIDRMQCYRPSKGLYAYYA